MTYAQILSPKALEIHIKVGLVLCGMSLLVIWLQTNSIAVIINAFAGIVIALTVGRWREQRDHRRKDGQSSTDAKKVENG